MFKHTIVITGITLLSAFGAVAGTVTTPTVNVTVTNTSGNALLQQFDPSLAASIPANPADLTFGVANLSLTNGAIEMIVIGLAGLIWLCRRRVFKALGRN